MTNISFRNSWRERRINGKGRYRFFLPFDDTELSIVGIVVSGVVLCAFVVIVVATVEVVDPSVALVL